MRPPPLSPRDALFLDFDGTLTPIVDRPELVQPDPARNHLLRQVGERLGGKLAVVSGRAIGDLDRFLDGSVTCLAGVHGLERRGADGAVRVAAERGALEPARIALSALAAAHPGLQFEDKGLGVAIHFRQAPNLEALAVAEATKAAEQAGLTLQRGHMVAEVRASGPDKGAAVSAFMTEAPFRGARPVFVGDDLTDEAGFAAAADLGGFGVRVGAKLLQGALYALNDPAAVVAWLEEIP